MTAAHPIDMTAPAAAPDTRAVIDLARVCLDFGRVRRLTRHPDGVTRETDTDHTVMLGIVGCAFAARHLPWLDLGLIAQYALVHDLVEVYADDTPTLRIDDAVRACKLAVENAAAERLRAEFGHRLPWVPDTIDVYESRAHPEARYVKALDKLLPKITHLLNGAVVLHDMAMGREELLARYADQLVELMSYAADFPPLFELRAELLDMVADQLCDRSGRRREAAGRGGAVAAGNPGFDAGR